MTSPRIVNIVENQVLVYYNAKNIVTLFRFYFKVRVMQLDQNK